LIQFAEYPNADYRGVVRNALQQWKDVRRAVRYEHLFIFMSGMTENEESAKTNHELKVHHRHNLQLPAYFESETTFDAEDQDDLPRRLVLMQAKCALEIEAAGKCGETDFLVDLLEALPYSDDQTLPDVNAEQDDEENLYAEQAGPTGFDDVIIFEYVTSSQAQLTMLKPSSTHCFSEKKNYFYYQLRKSFKHNYYHLMVIVTTR
jgi:hypothetical protein